MKRNIIASVLAMTIMSTMFAGCASASTGGAGTTNSEASETQTESSETTEASTSSDDGAQEIVNLYMEWPSAGTSSEEGIQGVEDALNELTEKEIGVHVTLEPVAFQDLSNYLTRIVSSGEQLDVSISIGTSLSSMVANGLIVPLDEYMDEYGQNLTKYCGDRLMGGYVNGSLYGFPFTDVDGNEYGYRARKDLLDKYGIEYDPDKLYTLDEMTEIFETVKAGEGDKFYCLVPEPNFGNPMHGAYMEIETLGATSSSGVLMLNRSFDDLTVVDMYETDEYMEFAKLIYSWAQKGFISGDALTTEEFGDTAVQSGNFLGYFSWTTPNGVYQASADSGYEMVPLTILPTYVTSTTGSYSWQVPSTSVNPQKAVELLDFIMGSPEATALLQWGIEGRDYEVVETNGKDKLIRYTAGNPAELPYYMPFGVYGYRLDWPVLEPMPLEMNQILRDFNAAIDPARKSAANGYAFDTTNVATEYSAVNAVIEQYVGIIECGTEDPAIVVPEFIEKLKAAGVDAVIAENQKQLDAWAAAK